MKIMLAKTDDAHSLTMPEILRALESYDVTAERKSIYADFETLRDLDIDIIGEKEERPITIMWPRGSSKSQSLNFSWMRFSPQSLLRKRNRMN